MSDKWKVMSGIIGSYLFAGGLIILVDYLRKNTMILDGHLPVTLWSMLILGSLLLSTLILINNGCRNIAKEVERYKERLFDTDNTLQEAQSAFNETVERRTFEISVINASLNREIAERIQAESESKQLQRRMELILESAGEGIFGLDTKGNVTFVNKAATKMLGWSADELIGKSHHNVVHHSHEDGSPHPIEKCPIQLAYIEGEVKFMGNDVFWTREGTCFHVEYVSTPILEQNTLVGAVVVFSDISHRLEVEREKNKLQRRMELILNSAGDGIFGLDTEGRVTFVNKAATLMLGWTLKELEGESLHDLIHHTHPDGSHHPAEECPMRLTCRDGQVHFSSDDIFWSKDGTSFPIEYVSTPILEDGVLTGAVIVFRDMNTFT